MRAAGARRVGRALVPAALPLAAGRPFPRKRRARSPSADPGRPIVLAVGRLAARRGSARCLKPPPPGGTCGPSLNWSSSARGRSRPNSKSQAARLRLDVRFPGHRDDVPALLASAAVFVLPSAWEGQPLILQEALRAGVPIVATRVGGTPELTGEDAALLVPPGDVAAAGRARFARCSTDPALAARLRQAAADRARTLPGQDDAVTAALAEYDQVARGASATGVEA